MCEALARGSFFSDGLEGELLQMSSIRQALARIAPGLDRPTADSFKMAVISVSGRTVVEYPPRGSLTLDGLWRFALRAPRETAAALETFRERARSWALVHVPLTTTAAAMPPRVGPVAPVVVRRLKRKAVW